MTFLPLSGINFLFGPIEGAVIFGRELMVSGAVEVVVCLLLKCDKCVCAVKDVTRSTEARLSGLTDALELSRWTWLVRVKL